VVVFDYVGAAPETLGPAKVIASAILERAGIGIDWAECAGRVETGKVNPCPRMMPFDIELRIQNGEMAKRGGFNTRCLGYAVAAEGFGTIVSVFHDRAAAMERDGIGLRQDIIGAAIAHEIGHLMLAERGHSRTGLMSARWDKQEFKSLAQGRFGFSASQVQRMKAVVEARSVERAQQLQLSLREK
jgi:hypothetical protein